MKQGARVPLRHRLLLGWVLLVLTCTVWPGYLPAARIEPYLLGLPFGLAWLALCIAAVFLALVFTFRADMRARRGGDRP